MLICDKFFSQVVNFNSPELNQVSTGISALRIRIPRKNYDGRGVEYVRSLIRCLNQYSARDHINVIVGDFNCPKINWLLFTTPVTPLALLCLTGLLAVASLNMLISPLVGKIHLT